METPSNRAASMQTLCAQIALWCLLCSNVVQGGGSLRSAGAHKSVIDAFMIHFWHEPVWCGNGTAKFLLALLPPKAQFDELSKQISFFNFFLVLLVLRKFILCRRRRVCDVYVLRQNVCVSFLILGDFQLRTNEKKFWMDSLAQLSNRRKSRGCGTEFKIQRNSTGPPAPVLGH